MTLKLVATEGMITLSWLRAAGTSGTPEEQTAFTKALSDSHPALNLAYDNVERFLLGGGAWSSREIHGMVRRKLPNYRPRSRHVRGDWGRASSAPKTAEGGVLNSLP